jgi:hypothetical protein
MGARDRMMAAAAHKSKKGNNMEMKKGVPMVRDED